MSITKTKFPNSLWTSKRCQKRIIVKSFIWRGRRVARSIRIIHWTSEMVHYSLWLTCSDQNVIRHSFGRKDNYNYCSWAGNELNIVFSSDGLAPLHLMGIILSSVWLINWLLTSFVWCSAAGRFVIMPCCVDKILCSHETVCCYFICELRNPLFKIGLE